MTKTRRRRSVPKPPTPIYKTVKSYEVMELTDEGRTIPYKIIEWGREETVFYGGFSSMEEAEAALTEYVTSTKAHIPRLTILPTFGYEYHYED